METNTLKDLKVLHLALVLGLLIVASLIYYMSERELNSISLSFEVDELLALLLAVANLFAVSYFHNKRLPLIRAMSSLEEKWIAYRALQIMKYALIEGAGLIAVVIFFTNGNILLLIIALILALTLYVKKPTIEKVVHDLKLTADEAEKL